jgi:hypothetical protein
MVIVSTANPVSFYIQDGGNARALSRSTLATLCPISGQMNESEHYLETIVNNDFYVYVNVIACKTSPLAIGDIVE